MLSKKRCIENITDALLETGHVQTSCSFELPDPIIPGHPVHNAVVRLETWYCGMMPSEGGRCWKELLQFSRDRDERVFGASDAFSSWLNEEYKSAVGNSVNDATGDGLVEMGYQLRWQGKVLSLQPQTWRILQYLGQRNAVTQQELEDEIWGDGEILKKSTFSQAIRRANKTLYKAGIEWCLRQKGGQVVRVLLFENDDPKMTNLVTLGS